MTWLYEAIRRTLTVLPSALAGYFLAVTTLQIVNGASWQLCAFVTGELFMLAYVFAGGTWEVRHEG